MIRQKNQLTAFSAFSNIAHRFGPVLRIPQNRKNPANLNVLRNKFAGRRVGTKNLDINYSLFHQATKALGQLTVMSSMFFLAQALLVKVTK